MKDFDIFFLSGYVRTNSIKELRTFYSVLVTNKTIKLYEKDK